MTTKSTRAASAMTAISILFASQSGVAQVRIIGNLPTPPSSEINTIQLQLNQLRDENKQLRAELTTLKKCFDEHRHWNVGAGGAPEITTPTATSKAPGFVPLPKYC